MELEKYFSKMENIMLANLLMKLDKEKENYFIKMAILNMKEIF